eukprot:2707698-Rhodomonas_salina.1
MAREEAKVRAQKAARNDPGQTPRNRQSALVKMVKLVKVSARWSNAQMPNPHRAGRASTARRLTGQTPFSLVKRRVSGAR